MYLEIEGLRTRYEAVGSGSPVVLLHGWGATLDAMRPIVHCLARDHQVLALDLPGFGESARPTDAWGCHEYARWLAGFMAAAGCARAAVLGHSFGGRVAICLAAERPERVDRLVLVDSAGVPPTRNRRHHLRVSVFRTLRRMVQAAPLPWRERLQERLLGRFGSSDYRSAGPMRAIMVRVVNEDLRPLLASIQAPALLVWGENDRDVPVSDGRVMAAGIRDSRLEVLSGAGHFAYMDCLPQFCRLVGDFLKDV